MFEESMEALYLGLAALVFCMAVTVMVTISRRYDSIEATVKQEVETKYNTTISEELNPTYADVNEVPGTTVFKEICEQKGTVLIRVNNEYLNSITSRSGLDFFSCVSEFGSEKIEKKIDFSATYEKELIINSKGAISEIRYTIKP